jgi:hypothetical protein
MGAGKQEAKIWRALSNTVIKCSLFFWSTLSIILNWEECRDVGADRRRESSKKKEHKKLRRSTNFIHHSLVVEYKCTIIFHSEISWQFWCFFFRRHHHFEVATIFQRCRNFLLINWAFFVSYFRKLNFNLKLKLNYKKSFWFKYSSEL